MRVIVDLQGNVLERHEDGFDRAEANRLYNLWWAIRLKRFIETEKAKEKAEA